MVVQAARRDHHRSWRHRQGSRRRPRRRRDDGRRRRRRRRHHRRRRTGEIRSTERIAGRSRSPHPAGRRSVDRVEVGEAAVATSGCRRAHLVDPSTGELCEPADVVQVSVLAGTGASAEALTKAVIVGGDRTSPTISTGRESACSPCTPMVACRPTRDDGDGIAADPNARRVRVNEQIWWYLARSAGMAAAVLMVGALVLGVLAATRALKEIDRPAWLVALHRWFSVLTVDRRRDPPRRPRRRQLRPLRTRRAARAGDVVVAPARRLARGDRPLPVRRRPRVVTGDEAAAQGVVAPAARPQLPVGVGGADARRHRRDGHDQRRVPGGRHAVDDGGGDGGVAARDPRPLRGARRGGAARFSRRGQERRAPQPTTCSTGR